MAGDKNAADTRAGAGSDLYAGTGAVRDVASRVGCLGHDRSPRTGVFPSGSATAEIGTGFGSASAFGMNEDLLDMLHALLGTGARFLGVGVSSPVKRTV